MRSKMMLAALAPMMLMGLAPTAAQGQTMTTQMVIPQTPIITLNVNETVNRTPDMAMLSVGVVTTAPTAAAALKANSSKMNALVAALKKAGIAEKDMQTSGLNVSPNYNYNVNPARFIGYQVSNELRIKTRDIAKLGQLLDALVAAGANNVNGPNFMIENEKPLLQEARLNALRKGQDQANAYAVASGYRSARLISINEGGSGYGGPVPVVMQAKAEAADASAPIAPGEVGVGVNLTLQYVMER